jgi:HEAT repeat protein
MENAKGAAKDSARNRLLAYGDKAVPYLEAILKAKKDSSDLQPGRENLLSNEYGVYIWDGQNSVRDDFAGTAAVLLSHLGDKAVGVLTAVVSDRQYDFQVRWRALIGLRILKAPVSPNVTNAVVTCLSDPLPLMRSMAAEVVGSWGDKAFLPELEKLVTDREPSVQQAAKEAVKHLKEGAAPKPVAHTGS